MIGDRYLLGEQVGAGATATVWRATDRLLERQVAVKRLAPGLVPDEKARERFKRGSAAAARLSHPGIVPVFDTGEDEEGPWVVMELVDGQTLADRLAEAGSLPTAEVVSVVAQVAAALDHAHSQGVVHRDIKPGNLVLEEGGRVRVMDFGLARPFAEAATITGTGEMVGTAAYLAPEIIRGGPATPASDIYSLGAVAYELISGRRPFHAENIMALLEAIRDSEPEPLGGAAPPEVKTAIERAMARDPEERFPTAGELAAALGDTATAVLPTPAPAPGDPTLVMPVPEAGPSEPPTPPSQRSWRLPALVPWVGGFIILLLLVLLALDDRRDDGDPGAGAAEPTTTVATTTTTPATTTQPATTLAPVDAEVAAAADAVFDQLEEMQPPRFLPPQIREIEEAVSEALQAWAEGRSERAEDRLERAFDLTEGLPESRERDRLEELLEELAERLEEEDDD